MEESLLQKRGVTKRIPSGAWRRCPFIESPCDDCFVARLNSQNIEQAIYYCGGNYEECEIYQRETGKHQKEKRGDG